MDKRHVQQWRKVHGPDDGKERTWTEVRISQAEFTELLGLAPGHGPAQHPHGPGAQHDRHRRGTPGGALPEPSIGRIIRRRVKRRVCSRLARMIHPIITAYIDIYDDSGGDEPDSGADDKQRVDLTGTVTGQFEVAANREHQVTEIIGGRRFGFGLPDRRA